MQQQRPEQVDQIKYVSYKDLQNPEPNALNPESIELGLESKDWRLNFDTLTHLRSANKFYSNVFVQQLLPKNYKYIIQQIDNLRSNNSKEALTLTSEILQYQKLQNVKTEILAPLVVAVFTKTVSEKGFLKKQALKGVNSLPKKYNPCLVTQFSNLTQSINGSISELAIKLLSQYIEHNKISEFDPSFYATLATNLEGKRALLQRKGKQILQILRKNKGQENLQQQIENLVKQNKLSEEQRNVLIRQLKKDTGNKTLQPQNFKDFLKLKKKADSV